MTVPSITLRLSLLFAAVATAVLLGVGWVLHDASEEHFVEQDTHELHGKIELIQHQLAQAGTPDAWSALPDQLSNALHGHHGLVVELRDARGHIVLASDTELLGFELDNLRRLAGDVFPLAVHTDSYEGRTYRSMAVRLPAPLAEHSPVTAVLAIDISHHEHFMGMFRRVLAISIALAIGVSGGLGWFAARRGLAPLHTMAEHARSISASRLQQRLATDDVPPELRDLVDAFNDMLARLEESFRRLSDFSSDIAHELRTPVSNLMTQTQVALSRARTDAEYREVLHSNLEEFDHLARMISDMLFLAKADNGLIIPQRADIVLEEEIAALFEFYEPLASELAVQLACSGHARISGDRLMVRRALSNLLSNALRHTPAGQTVRVDLTEEGGQATAAVVNPGTTIPPEHLPRLFDRFYRADASRHKTTEGAGLGLAITRSIIEAHGGRIEATSEDGITRFTLRLPR